MISLKLRELKAILIDLDGTLAQSLPFLRQAYFDFLSAGRIQGKDSEFVELSGPSLQEIVFILKERHQLEQPAEELYKQYLAHLQRHYSSSVTPFPGAAALLDFLRGQGLRLTLVTSAPRSLAEAFLEKHAFQSHFEHIICGEDVPQSKPHPAVYQLALAKLDLPPSAALAIEDSESGVRAAHGAGLDVIAVHRSNTEETPGGNGTARTYCFESLSEVKDFIQARHLA